MALVPKSFSTLVQDAATAIQGKVSSMLDFSVGSVIRAIMEANASVVLWLQGLILQLLSTTRASTSSGTDLDSWMADYGISRLPAVASEGVVTFARYTPTQQASIPVGTVIQTGDGTQQFVVIADTTQQAYSASAGAYILGAGVASITASVQAQTAGTAGNVLANTITVLAQSLPGVDTVNNAAAFVNGADAEADAALRTRFQEYLQALSKATRAAVGYAIESLQQGLTFSIVEDEDDTGVRKLAYFYVVIDNGTGNPDSTLLSTVYNAVEAVRPLGITFNVYGPTVQTAQMSLSITVAPGYVPAAVASLVHAAIVTYINTLPMGQFLPYTRIDQLAYDASPGVTDVTGVLLNGTTADLTVPQNGVIKAGLVTVSSGA